MGVYKCCANGFPSPWALLDRRSQYLPRTWLSFDGQPLLYYVPQHMSVGGGLDTGACVLLSPNRWSSPAQHGHCIC